MADPESATTPAAAAERGREWLGPALSGVATFLAFPPASIPVFAFVGLVPLFRYFWRPRSAGDAFRGGAAFAIPYFVAGVYWLFHLGRFTPAGPIGAFGAIAMHLGTFVFFVAGVNVVHHRTRISPLITLPLFWTVTELARATGDFYFPWVTLGYALSDWPALIQHADVLGVYGLTGWLAFVNVFLARATMPSDSAAPDRGPSRRIGFRPLPAAVAVVLVALPVAYGHARFRAVEARLASARTLDVAIVQPNVDQAEKWEPSKRRIVLDRVREAIDRAERAAPDLVVGPEASLPMVARVDDVRLPRATPDGTTPLLLGVVRAIGEPEALERDGRTVRRYTRFYNSAVLAAPDRTVIDVHDKRYLVPVTEQVPFEPVFGFVMPLLAKQFGRFEKGPEPRPLELRLDDRVVPIAATVCYESLFPALVRKLSGEAMLLANLTNDAWFGRSTMSHQHLGFLVLRAIENRRAVVRSANTGISAFIDPLGRVWDETGLYEEAVIRRDVPLLSGRTVYARVGDVWSWLSVAGVAVLLGLAARGPRRTTRVDERG